MMAHVCNPSYSEGKGRRIAIRGWPGKNKKSYLKKTLKAKGWWGEGWLKCYDTCLASTKP
jgi:hypothetical protein